jgi:hypothetical protein
MLKELEVTKKDSIMWAIMVGATAIIAIALLLNRTNENRLEAFNRESKKIHAAALVRHEQERFLAKREQ